MLQQMLTANVDRSVLPPKRLNTRKWKTVDSGSQPNVADCRREFPDHAIHTSEGQKMGLRYKAADGSLIANEGEVHIQHQEDDGEVYDFTVQHAKVQCTIISVRYLVTRDCIVTFQEEGAFIEHPSGKRLHTALQIACSSLR